MNIYITNDHAGTSLKYCLLNHLSTHHTAVEIINLGTNTSESVDYPDQAHLLANSLLSAMEKQEKAIGIAICGSGNGINITLNKYANIRSALCWNKEIATLARQHNDANVLTLPARFISNELAVEILDIFLSTRFEAGRHATRINKIQIQE